MENAYDGAKRKGGASMKRDEILALLRGYRAELEEYGVKSLAIFGSVARNEETDQSDVDILVEFGRPVGLFEFVRVKNHLEKILDNVFYNIYYASASSVAPLDRISRPKLHIRTLSPSQHNLCSRRSWQYTHYPPFRAQRADYKRSPIFA